jgi:L-ascorbate metabolism protein UlaG (beta-lactamase superfamily)
VKRAVLAMMVVTSIACGRVKTVIRGSTSVFRSSEPAPRHDTPAHDELAMLWVGHATVLLEIGGRVVVTDPVTTATVGQLSKRVVKPGLPAEGFPNIDLVAISHVHYDHLSLGSLGALENKIEFLAMPEGGLAYLPEYSFDAMEVEPWKSVTRGALTFTATPAKHLGWRYGFDGWSHVMGGWVFESAGKAVYFAGDTGYDAELFRAIGKRFPHLDLALLPIAPMEPHGLIAGWHMNPKEALQAFVDLGAARMMPIHYDTFINSLDDPGDAIPQLLADAKAAKVAREKLEILQIGERRVLIPRKE